MIDEKYVRTLLIIFCLVILTLGGCGSKDEKQASTQTELQKPEAPRQKKQFLQTPLRRELHQQEDLQSL